MGDIRQGTEFISAAQVVEIAREVIREYAPEELVVFDTTANAWMAGRVPRRRPRRVPPGAVGSGVETQLLVEIVFPVLTNALGQVLGVLAIERGRRKRRAAVAVDASQSGDRGLHLTGPQVKVYREACRNRAMALGLAPGEAEQFADACLGALITAGLS